MVRGGEVTCLSVKSDFCSFLITERGSLDGETKSCLCLGRVELALSPGEPRIQRKGEQAPSDHMPHKGLSLDSYYDPHLIFSSRTFPDNPNAVQ